MADNSRGFIHKLIAGLSRSIQGSAETEDMFLSMIQVALEDKRIAGQMLNLLEKDSNERRVHLQVWVDELTRNGAPDVFIRALLMLREDDRAERAKELLSN